MLFSAFSVPMQAPNLQTQIKARLTSVSSRIRALGLAMARRLGAVWGRLALTVVLFILLDAAGLPWGPSIFGMSVVMAMIVMGDGSPPDEQDEAIEREGGTALRGGGSRDRSGDSWRPLIDALPEGAIALDQNGYVMHFNALVLDLFAKARVGAPLTLISRNPELNAAVERSLATGDKVTINMVERVPVDRRIEATVSSLSANRDRRGMPVLLVTFRDMTEQDKLAQMRADFIANASHELRTPLASLRGFVETLQGPAKDDPNARARFLGIMASQAQRMTRLIDDLLSLSRVEMRVHLPPKGIVDLNDVATHVAQSLEPLAASSKVSVQVTKLDGASRIRGERDEIVQVVQNLVHNAIKYGREGGVVEIAISRVMDGSPPQERLLLAVADNGLGIAAEHLPRLTERFYRANPAASREKGGTGLGLAIVKHILIRHRAELRISSDVGVGSTFSVLFDGLSAGA